MKYRHYKNPFSDQEGEQGYLISVSDMMSGLIFLFIITLMIFVINLHFEKLKKAYETKELQDIQEKLTDAKEVRKILLEDLKESLERRGVIVRIDTDKGLLHVPENILFESGKADFMQGGEKSLRILSDNLAEKLPCYCGRRSDLRPSICKPSQFKPGRLEAVLVEGHTDNVPIHNLKFESNLELSAKRSIITYNFLLKSQPSLEKMLNSDGEPLLGVSGYGESRPVVFHKEFSAEPLNRRIDLRFILAAPEANVIQKYKDKTIE